MTRRMRKALLNTHTRRAITIPAFIAGWVFGTFIFPFVIPGTAVADFILRRKLTVVRALLQAYVFICVEMVTLAVLAYLTAARMWMSEHRWLAAHDWLQGWWARVQFNWARRIYQLRVVVEGEEALDGKPFILLIRHVSILDNLIPAVYAVDGHGQSMKWVLNWFLLRDPCIDIVGHRLGGVFVRGGTSPREVLRIRQMAETTRPGQGIVLYPEGTLYSPAKYERMVRKVEQGRDEEWIEFVKSLRNTLPPRLGGTLGLLELRPDLDVVFCSHSGLEGSLDKASIIAGSLVRQRLRIAFWRVPAEAIPKQRAELRRWLFAEWRRVDAFVGGANER
jgi:1-acyl-sn-glycerol-3-phosphate acyltransferase